MVMLTVFIVINGYVVYARPFENHKEAIDHFCELRVEGMLFNDSALGITNVTEIPLKPSDERPPFVV